MPDLKRKRQVFFSNGRITFKNQVKKFAGDKEGPVTTVMGYPILWDQLSSDRGGYCVRIPKGSTVNFSKPCFALWNHDFAALLGNTANDTLRIGKPDDIGIPIEIDLPDTSYGRDAGVLVCQGYCSGMSFSMVNGFEDYTESKVGDQKIVDVSKFTVDDVTITPIPAFSGTSIGPKDDDDEEDEEELSRTDQSGRTACANRLNQLRLSMLRP